MMRTLLLTVSVLLLICGAAWATVQTYTPVDAGTNGAIHFSFDGSHLALNTPSISWLTYGGDGSEGWYLTFHGRWAAAGTWSSQYPGAVFTPDPYATFVIDGNGSGHITWAPNTPLGYYAPLVLGVPGVWPDQYGGIHSPDYLELTHYTIWAGMGNYTYYTPGYTFNASMPEPSTFLALGAGLMGLVGVARRRRS